ncbi:MAG TPA: hypothetical protein VN688_07145 [Gemmataceae bacterium]|nr:hypothetical protein [Gemmataceae bacterium]
MNRLLSPWFVRLSVIACLAFAPGCGKPSAKLVPVAGKVTLGGQPITAGHVSLVPLSKEEKAGLSSGSIGSDGSYKILTNNKEGAPLGKYKVTVTPSTMPTQGQQGPPVSIPMVYRDTQRTILSIEVVDQPEAGRYDLKLNK